MNGSYVPYPTHGHNDYLHTQVHMNENNGHIRTSIATPETSYHDVDRITPYNNNSRLMSIPESLHPQHYGANYSTARYGTYDTSTQSVKESAWNHGLTAAPYQEGEHAVAFPAGRKQSFTTASLFDMIARSQLTSKNSNSIKAKKASKALNGIAAITKSLSKNRLGTRDCRDEEKRLYTGDLTHVNYGNIVAQIKEVNRESKGCLEFLSKSYRILHGTVVMTAFLMLVLGLPVGMVILGVKFLHDCPKEPFLPIYLLVGGCFGMLKMFTILWRQMRERKSSDAIDSVDGENQSDFMTDRSTQFTDMVLTLFLLIWFGFGNFWTWRIYKPHFSIQLYEPMDWCEQTLYMFCVVQIIACYAGFVLFLTCLACLGCTRYILQSS